MSAVFTAIAAQAGVDLSEWNRIAAGSNALGGSPAITVVMCALGLWAWDRGEPDFMETIVADGMRKAVMFPPAFAQILMDITAGRRKVNRKAKVKLKAQLGVSIPITLLHFDLMELVKRRRAPARGLRDQEDRQSLEASRARLREFETMCAVGIGISRKTLKGEIRALRRLIVEIGEI